MDRNLSVNLARVTEAAALASAKYLGKGDKEAADQAAVDAMRRMFDTVDVDGVVVIGEGEMDEAPMLYIGEKIGKRGDDDLKVDIAVDPVDGTTSVANGLPNAISVVAVAPRGCLLHAPDTYMKKIAVGPKAKGAIDIHKSVEENIISVANTLRKSVEDITVVVLDRPRHTELLKEIRRVGARIKLISDGDVFLFTNGYFDEKNIPISGDVVMIARSDAYGIKSGMDMEEVEKLIGEPERIIDFKAEPVESELFGINTVAYYEVGDYEVMIEYDVWGKTVIKIYLSGNKQNPGYPIHQEDHISMAFY